MLTKEEKSIFRSEIFRHLDGIVTAPVAYILHKKGVLDYLLKEQKAELGEIARHFGAMEGYMNVALRVLASQGWLNRVSEPNETHIYYEINERSKIAFDLTPIYKGAVDLLHISGSYHPRRFEQEPFRIMRSLFDQYLAGFSLGDADGEIVGETRKQIFKHIEGMLIGPTIVHLGMSGMFHKYFMEASFTPEEFHSDPESFRQLLRYFVALGWFEEKNGTFRFTEKGFFFARRASAYGVTVSYMPMFRQLEELMFGDPATLRRVPAGGTETHVDREMNVWGSGGAHSTYFKQVDTIIIDIFNRPIHEQPKGILDMGCGNGAFLMHIYEVIEKQTLRGRMLDEYPLFLIGADYNEAALKVTRANLIQADIWAKIIWGDIGDPEGLAMNLKENYGLNLGDLLNVRTFLDHNRIWKEPDTQPETTTSSSTGAFAYLGRRIPNYLVEQSLKEHLQRWAPYVGVFGLLVIELHTISPQLTANNLGRTAATAYDATHGFSDQYIVEVEVFQKVAARAGLKVDQRHFARYPDSDLATVSINLLRSTTIEDLGE